MLELTTLNSLDILYITLSIFVAIIWTLLSIVLFRLIKILWPVMEIVWYYNKLKEYLAMYAQIPSLIKEKIFELFSRSNDEDNYDNEEKVVKKVKNKKKKKKK